MDSLEEVNYFSTTIYAVEKPEFLDPIRVVSEKYLLESKTCQGNKMTVMTQNFSVIFLIASARTAIFPQLV